MLYSDYLKQQNAALDKQFSGNANMTKVQDSRFVGGSGWMPKGMADGSNHTKHYNAYKQQPKTNKQAKPQNGARY